MKQTRLMSFVESFVNIAVGLGVALIANAIVLPLFGFNVTLAQNLGIAAIMTVVSIVRSYGLRRLFEALHIRNPLSPAANAIIAERRRQIEVEGWDPSHDDQHEAGELALAGACYALNFSWPAEAKRLWPWLSDWWKPLGFRRDLVRAGALILAEIERWDRTRKRKPSERPFG